MGAWGELQGGEEAGRRPTPRGRDKEREQAGPGGGGGEEAGEAGEPARADARGGEGQRLGMGEEDRSWGREGEREEVGQRPRREQEDEGSDRENREASVTNALQLPLVSDAPPQVGQLCISAQLLQRHAAERMAVARNTLVIKRRKDEGMVLGLCYASKPRFSLTDPSVLV